MRWIDKISKIYKEWYRRKHKQGTIGWFEKKDIQEFWILLVMGKGFFKMGQNFKLLLE